MTTVGVLGGGQLGRMLALAGLPLGLRFRFLEPADESPAGQVAERIVGSFDDAECLDRFADGLDLVTYEFENVPTAAARRLAERVPVYPPPAAWRSARTASPRRPCFNASASRRRHTPRSIRAPTWNRPSGMLGYPAVLKTRRMGYDGKGQTVLRGPADVERAWRLLGESSATAGGVHSLRPRGVAALGARPGRRRRLLSAGGEPSRPRHLALVAGPGAGRVAGTASAGQRLRRPRAARPGLRRRPGDRVLPARRSS